MLCESSISYQFYVNICLFPILCNWYVSAYTFKTWLMSMCVLSGHANTDQISDDYSLHSWNSSILINRIFCSATIRFFLTYGLLDCKIVVN
jgi:hypothetical protein